MRLAYWIALAALVAAYMVYAAVTVDRRSDEVRIRALIQDAAAAVEKRDLSRAMGAVSRDYRDESGLNYDRLRALAAQALREDAGYRVAASISSVSIEGESASVQMHATVRSAASEFPIYDSDLTLLLRKEPTLHARMLPTRVWRVVSIGNLGLDASDRL